MSNKLGGFKEYPLYGKFRIAVANWNIMDHTKSAFSRVGNPESEEEYMLRYVQVLGRLEKFVGGRTLDGVKRIIDVICLEEVSEVFLDLLQKNLTIMNEYDIYEYQSPDGKFMLATLIKKNLEVNDYTQDYQKFYENNDKNRGYSGRAQILLVNDLLIVHVHLMGVPGSIGDTYRTNNLIYIMNFINRPMQQLYTYNKIIIGDFNIDLSNITEDDENLTSVYLKNNLQLYDDSDKSDSRFTSFHRFVKHDGFYEDKRASINEDGTPKIIFEKLDYLLYGDGVTINPNVIKLPYGGIKQMGEIPYLAAVSLKNREKIMIDQKEIYKIIDPTEVTIRPNYGDVNKNNNNGWPSDHSLTSYLIDYEGLKYRTTGGKLGAKTFPKPNKLKKSKISRNRSRSISPPQKPNARSRSRSAERSMRVSRTRSRSSEKEVTITNETIEDKEEEIRLERKNNWNPITFERYSDRYYKLQEKVKLLPVSQEKVKQDIFNILNDTNIMLITADTGAGKTSQIPKMIWEYLNYNETVLCTQPRTLTTAEMAKRVSAEMDLELGRHIGFRYKGSEKEKGGDIAGSNILVYMTENTFLNNTLKDLTSLSAYGAVIIDEAHDRTISTDVLMFYIRETLNQSALSTKFIIMSATLDKEVFLNYFKGNNIKQYHISGRTFPITTNFLKQSIYQNANNDLIISFQVERMTKIIINDIFVKRDNKINENSHNDILVFLPSKAKIMNLKESLTNFLEEKKIKNFIIYDLSADVPKGAERDLRMNPIPGYTKIILSTNIAETGVTVEGITYVIDSGLAFNVEFDMETREDVMDQGFISQAEANQRMGRSGRMQPGFCYRLYTREEYDKFITHKKPAIYRERFDSIFLQFLFQYRGIENSFNFILKEVLNKMIAPPTKKGIDKTIEFFREMNIVEGHSGEDTKKTFSTRITKFGQCFMGMEMKFESIYLLFTAIAYEVEPEIIADIVAMLEIKSDMSGWRKNGDIPEKYLKKYSNEYGDIIGLYHIYLDYKDGKLPKAFLKENLNLINFDKVQENSERIQQDIAKLELCGSLVEPKYKLSNDMYLNFVLAVKQVYGKKHEIMTKELDMNRYRNNFLEIKKLERVIYLSNIIKKIFGKNPTPLFDNFISVK